MRSSDMAFNGILRYNAHEEQGGKLITKKKTLKPIVCAAVIALILSITACGGSDDGDPSPASDSATVEDTENTKDLAELEEEADAASDSITAEDTTNTEDPTEPETEADTAEETDAAEGAKAGDGVYFETLEEAFADPEVRAAMDEQLSTMGIQGMENIEISYEVTDNDFIVSYKILNDVNYPDDFAERMESVMDELEPLYSADAEMFDEGIGKEGATSVIARFLDAADTLLIERAYKAE